MHALLPTSKQLSPRAPPVPPRAAIGSQWVQTPRHGDPIDRWQTASPEPVQRSQLAPALLGPLVGYRIDDDFAGEFVPHTLALLAQGLGAKS